jgi:hypothetical protein
MKKMVHLFLALFTTGAALAQSSFIYAPAGSQTVEGNSSTMDPFTSSSFRFQQVYSASLFGPGPWLISQIAFRIDGGSTNQVDMFFSGSSLTLSTTARAPDALSPVFADNRGLDAVTVRTGGAGFGGLPPSPGSTAPFSSTFSFQTPFYYTPAQGNLLIEFAGVAGDAALPGAMDAQSTAGDSVSWVYALNNLASSGTPSTLGLITRLQVSPVPEPATWVLSLLGLAASLIFKKRK